MGVRVSLTLPAVSINLYLANTLKLWIADAGMELVDPADADYLFFSMCDPDDLPALRKLRKENPGKPIIAGGFEMYFANPYFAWIDHAVVGEGWRFIDLFGRDPDAALALPNVMNKYDDVVEPDYYMAWDKFPVAHLPVDRYYFLAGKGCYGKCTFCATSWCMPYQRNNPDYIERALQHAEKKRRKITMIGNDSMNLRPSKSMNAQSVTVKRYLQNPSRYKSQMLHIGVEGWTEAHRRAFAKPVAHDDILDMIDALKVQKQRAELFFIVGYDDWTMDVAREFIESIPYDPDIKPQLYIKTTYLDAPPHTPIADVKIDHAYCDIDQIFRWANSRNKRFRTFPMRSSAREAWRTCIRRCTPDEALLLGPEPKGKNRPEAFAEFQKYLDERGLLSLLWRKGACSNIMTQTKMSKSSEGE